MLSASGTATTLTDIDVGGEDVQFFLEEGATGSVDIVDNSLNTIAGNGTVRVEDGEGEFLRASLTFEYAHQPERTITGTGQVEVTRVVDLGITNNAGYNLLLMPGGGAIVDIADNALQTLTANIPLRIDDEQGELFAVTLNGTYDHQARSFSGLAQGDLLRTKEIGKMGEYTFFAEPGTSANLVVADNDFDSLMGSINGRVEDAEGDLIHFQGEGTVRLGEEGGVTVNGSAELVREKLVTQTDRFAMSFLPGAGATLSVVDSQIQELGGTLTTRVDVDGAPFAQIDLQGTWSEEAGFNGQGSAELLVDRYMAAEMGEYQLWLIQGTGAQVSVTDSQISEITASLPLGITKGGEMFMEGNLEGTYDFNEESFSGSGSLAVVADQHLATIGSEEFWLNGNSSAEVDITNNQMTRIGGNVALSLRDGEGEYLQIAFDGQYDMAGGTGFTGSGGATVVREKEMFSTGSYAFAITEGTGFSAAIGSNEITNLEGNIPFLVYQDGAPLLRGQVTGDWQASTGYINGTGSIELARDLEFDSFVVRAGSMGQGEVVNSELEYFEGNIDAELRDEEGPIATISAQGKINAKEAELEHLEGSVTLLRDLEPFDGVIISALSGRGIIEHNEIKEVVGAGQLAIPDAGITGSIEAGWRNEGGESVYWGTANASLQMQQDLNPGKRRFVQGASLSATLNEDKTFDLSGGVQYQLTENIFGDLNIEMDETLDPILAGSLNASGQWMEARDVFSWEKDLINKTILLGFIPLSFGLSAGASLGLQPLNFTFGVAVSDFHLFEMSVPNLDGASLDLDWGLDLEAVIAPWAGIGFSFGDIFTLLAGLEGQIKAVMSADVGISAELHGGGDEFYGSLGVAASLSPDAILQLNAILEAKLFGMGGDWDYPLLEYKWDDILPRKTEFQTRSIGPHMRAVPPFCAHCAHIPAHRLCPVPGW